MVASFNVKFQSRHDKDVLKNRYKHLRRIYNDVQNFLQDNGFSWDETREMITAEDYIWDAYIEEHPDAQSFRVKTIPGYWKLCVIFGQENLDRRYSRLSQSVDLDEDTPVLIIDESSVDLIDWQPAMDRYLIDLMLEQLHGGNKIGYTFNEQSWALMVESFNVKFRVLCSRYILENWFATLLKEFDDISSLLSQSGFAWDASQQKTTADDAVWEAYIQGQPHAIAYRNKVLENYIDFCHIRRNGLSNIGDQGLQLHNKNDAEEVTVHVLLESVSFPVEKIRVFNQQKKRPTTAPVDKGHSNKMQKISIETQRALSDTADALKTSSKKESKGTIEYAIEALQAIPGIDDELLLDACDLMEDYKKAKTFLALDASLRMK